ncbi:MAG: hypothetical protein B6242_06630 [Anaerolineaceae bacterium 4572_78]|nr:MAG: hypothetical protein B6242_06630 [Anaerolineaceae bacterium 4572_78]
MKRLSSKFILLSIIVVSILTLLGCGASSTPQTVSDETNVETSTPTEEPKPIATKEDIVTETGLRYPENLTSVDEADYVTTDSGLQYYDFTEGEGDYPQQGQSVTVHYTGWLHNDGTKFDSSLDRGQPFTFKLGLKQVISGWDEGLSTMKVGGKRQLVIPPELAYGDSDVGGGIIPANSTLVFEVELLQIE